MALDWFGGEPLLAMDIVADVQEHALALCLERPHLNLRSSMTTNAFLLDTDKLTYLLQHGVREFHIALDGARQIHDKRRVTARGDGTFDRIWANLLAARRLEDNFEIAVRLQIGDESLASFAEFLNLYARELASDSRFELAVVPLSCLHPSRSAPSDPRRAIESAKAVRQGAQALDIRLQAVRAGTEICHASRANSFIVRSDGTLAKCPVALYRQENHVGKLLEDGRVELDAAKMSGWMRGLECQPILEEP